MNLGVPPFSSVQDRKLLQHKVAAFPAMVKRKPGKKTNTNLMALACSFLFPGAKP